ncbi:winged helix DNA-binding domain-containing protein [Pseudoxanthomonas sp. UTMC 1351]|uniref:winged helix DNA-binding domain-containing protein n=1 Tax=Pseudoxanthomonas sp. UTMC 1351 TaxID=2695853 RepID=UPI0034CF5775
MAPNPKSLLPDGLAFHRLHNQRIALPISGGPGEVVRHLGAVQAQDYQSALWAIGLRITDATQADVEQAIANREIVRTWPMRGTLHLVAAADVRWMLSLMATRVIALNAARIEREFGLDTKSLARCRKVITRALADGQPQTRSSLYATLEQAAQSTSAQRSLHILGQLAQEGIICQGPRIGKQPSFVLLDAWVPKSADLSREQALGELGLRYFRGHGPATVQDLAWWSGLTLKDTQAALALAKPFLQQESIGDATYWFDPGITAAGMNPEAAATYLLPAFDEYLVGYKDRSAALDPAHTKQVIGVNGIFASNIVIEGRVSGLWKRGMDKQGAALSITPLRPLKKHERAGIAAAAQRIGRFLDSPVRVL